MLSGTHILLLRDAEERRYLPIPIGPNEANAIAYHLQGVRPERPLTHDIATLMMNALGAELREVRIVELRDETFRARMLVAPTGGAVQELDARPSDAVALALRANAPIFISLDLLAAEGIVPEAAEEERLSLFRDFVNSLDGEQPNDVKGSDPERCARGAGPLARVHSRGGTRAHHEATRSHAPPQTPRRAERRWQIRQRAESAEHQPQPSARHAPVT